MSNREHSTTLSAAYAGVVMVEYNHEEERLARIEQMVERLQRENAASRVVTTKLVAAIAVVAENTHALQAASGKAKAR